MKQPKEIFESIMNVRKELIDYHRKEINHTAFKLMEHFLKEEGGEYGLKSGVRAMYDYEVVYITAVFLYRGKALWYAYEGEFGEYQGNAPATDFEVHHDDVADELVKTYNHIQKGE